MGASRNTHRGTVGRPQLRWHAWKRNQKQKHAFTLHKLETSKQKLLTKVYANADRTKKQHPSSLTLASPTSTNNVSPGARSGDGERTHSRKSDVVNQAQTSQRWKDVPYENVYHNQPNVNQKMWLKTGCSVKRTSSVDRGIKTEVSWYAMPGGDCVQPRPSFTVASSNVKLSRCDWTMFTS